MGDRFRREKALDQAQTPVLTNAPADPAALPPSSLGHDLDAPGLYLNRELTWLAFNRRVLHEAQDERIPLLERVKFVAIAVRSMVKTAEAPRRS